MNKFLLSIGAIFLSVVQPSFCGWGQPIKTRNPGALRVLFIGNSFTYFNDTPRIFQVLAETSNPGLKVETQLIASGGATLEDHWEQGDAKSIAKTDWDFVVLQEQSTFGGTLLVNGKFRIPDPEKSFAVVRRFDSAIKKAGAKTIVVAHWKEKNSPSEDQDILDCDFARLARELKATVVPIGRVWATSMKLHPEIKLYFKDDLHPAPAGSYLFALTLYRTIFESMPKPALTVRGARYDQDEGKVVEQDSALLSIARDTHNKLLAAVEPGIARFDQQMQSSEKCPAPELPILPKHGPQPGATGFLGNWNGTLSLYPIPAHFKVTVAGKNALTGHLHITFEGNPKIIDTDLKDVAVTPAGLSFVDPQGPNGGVVRFKGVLIGRTLKGIAVIENAPVQGVGEWTATRQ